MLLCIKYKVLSEERMQLHKFVIWSREIKHFSSQLAVYVDKSRFSYTVEYFKKCRDRSAIDTGENRELKKTLERR